MTPKKKTHYVNNKDLYAAMVTYREKMLKAEAEGRPLPKVPD